jgi:hypothetical protein
MDYHERIKTIYDNFPNGKKSDYEKHSEVDVSNRIVTVAETSRELHRHFTDRQPEGYRHTKPGRTVVFPTDAEYRATELLADYILADDHAKGLKIMRSPNEIAGSEEMYPPLGEGAREYLEREYIGIPLSIGERRKTKTCEICESHFVDKSRNFKAKVCGDSCRTIKEARRKRSEYNKETHGIDHKQLKRERERQDLEYGFYSPVEMSEFMRRGELSIGGINELERKATWSSSYLDYNGNETKVVDNVWRLNGKRKPMYVGRDEFDADKPFIYQPKGRNDREPKNYDHLAGEVIEYTLSKEEYFAMRIRLEKAFIPRKYRVKANNTSENYAYK